jgi:conjugal transfer pilin signal peptidase TrbI
MSSVAATFRGSRPVSKRRAWLAISVGLACASVLFLGYGRSFVSLTYDPHEVNCLPELHMALLVHRQPQQVARGDYLFWKASSIPALSYVHEDYVLKRVAGLPGDRLMVRDEKVYVNDQLVAEGLEDAVLYRRSAADFERTEVIPPGRYFVVGTARLSNDSRYWGYLTHEQIVGKGYRIF